MTIDITIASTEDAIKWITEEHSYLKELAEFIKQIRNKEIEQQEKDLKIAFRLYRWAETAEKRAESAVIAAEAELKQIAKTLPEEQRDALIKIAGQLDALSKSILKETTAFFNNAKEEMATMPRFRQLDEPIEYVLFYPEPQTARLQKNREKFKSKYEEFKQKKETFAIQLRILLDKIYSDIEKIIPLLDSIETVLKQARDFEKRISEHITEQSIQQYSKYWPGVQHEIATGMLPWPDLVNCLTNVIVYMPEAILFFPFMENVVRICEEKKIDTIYALDKSGRLMGFLIHQVLLNLGISEGIDFYFFNPKNTTELFKYFKENAPKLKDKQILIIDEYIYRGDQVSSILKQIKPILENGRVYAAIFSSVSRDEIEIARSILSDTGREYAVYDKIPSWWRLKEYSGVRELETNTVLEKRTQAEPRIREIAASVRNSLILLAKAIAQYLKNKGY